MNSIQCPSCKSFDDNFYSNCQRCNYPFKGSSSEQSLHIGRYISEKGILEEADKSLKKSQRILLLFAGLNFISFLVMIFQPEYSWIDAVAQLFICGVFALFGIFMKRSPIVFTVIPLIFLTMLYIANGLTDPQTFSRGFIFKIALFGSLIYAVHLNFKAQKFRDKYQL